MAGLGAATVTVLANTAGFEQSLRRSFKRMAKVGLALAAVGAGVGAVNFFGSAIKDSIEVERQLAKIKTFVETPADMKLFDAKKVRAFSTEIGISMKETTDAMYLALGSGVAAKDVFDVTAQGAKLAVATGSELPIVIDAMTSSLNAYAEKGYTATDVTDILFKAFQYGKGSMRDFARYISNAIPIASQLGVKLEDLASLGAASTLTGKTARVAFTGLKVAMQDLTDETTGSGKAFKETFGETFQEQIARTKDLPKALANVSKALGAKNLTKIFGAKEGAAAVQNLAALGKKVGLVVQGTKDFKGAAGKAFADVDKTVSRQIDRLKVAWQNYRGSIGDALGPATKAAVDTAQDILNGFIAFSNEYGSEIKAVFLSIWNGIKDVVGAAVDAVVATFNKLKPALSELIDSIKAAQPAFQKIWDGILAVIGGFVGIGLALVGAFGPVVIGVITAAFDLISKLEPIMILLGAAIGAVVVAQKLYVTWTAIMAAVTASLNAGVLGYIVTFGIWQATMLGVRIAATAMWTAIGGPVGAIILLIVALGAGFVVAWKKSETFRKVVVTALNGIKDVFIEVVQFIVNRWLDTVDLLVSGAAKAFGWIPGIGPKLREANRAFDNFSAGVNASLNAIQDKDIKVTINRDYGDLDGRPVDSTGRPLSGPGYTNADKKFHDEAMAKLKAEKELKAQLDKLKIDPMGGVLDFGGGGGSGGGTDAADAKKKASEAAKIIKAALGRVLTDLNRLAKNTSKQTLDTLKNNFKTLYEDLAEGARKDLIPAAKKVEKQLLKLAASRDGLGAKYKGKWRSFEDLKTILKDLKKESAQFVDGIKRQVTALGNVTDESKGLGTTYTGIRNQLRGAIAMTKQFTAYITKLRKMKLNDTNLKQLIDAGPEAGMAAAKALVGAGQAAITGKGGINDLQKQLNDAGGKLATTANDHFYKAGITLAEGIVKGLESQEAKIMKKMDELADKMAATYKKKIKSKSPSKLFEDLTATIPAGMVKGLEGGGPKVSKSMSNVTNNMISVAVSGVADPFAAHRAGIMSGEGITSVLEKRRTAAALAQ